MRRLMIVAAAVLALASARAQSAAAPKIGVFDGSRAAAETQEGKAMQAALAALRAKKNGELEARQKEIADLQAALNDQALSLSPDKRDDTQKSLQKKMVELNQFRQSAQSDVQIETQDAQEKFGQELSEVVAAFGRDEGFTAIFERSSVFYASPAIDVTAAVVQRFDAMFPGGAAKPATPAPATGKK